jgi:hypothetical protein
MQRLKEYVIEYNKRYLNESSDDSIYINKPEKLFEKFPQGETETDEEYKLRIESYLATRKEDVDKLNKKLEATWVVYPYKTVIYNKGPKNRNWWITRKNMCGFMDRAEHPAYIFKETGSWDDKDKKWELDINKKMTAPRVKGIIMDLAPDDICFTSDFSMKNIEQITNKFTKAPEVERYIYVEPFWGDSKYETKQINKILDSYSEYFKSGKLEVTLSEAPEGMDKDWLYMKVTDEKFLKDVEEEIKRMTDLDRLKAKKIKIDKEAAEAVEKAKKEREEMAAAAAKAEEARKKAEEAARAEMNSYLDQLRKEGASEEEIQKAKEEWNIGRWLDQYGNQD